MIQIKDNRNLEKYMWNKTGQWEADIWTPTSPLIKHSEMGNECGPGLAGFKQMK